MTATKTADMQAASTVDRLRANSLHANGFALVGLLEAGDDIQCGGAWRTIQSIAGASDDRLHLTMTDGTEWIAAKTAMRRSLRPERAS